MRSQEKKSLNHGVCVCVCGGGGGGGSTSFNNTL